MCFKFAALALVCLSGVIAHQQQVKDKRQVGTTIVQKEDHVPAETGFGNAAVQGGGKYFQYIHVPAKDHYEHGHKRGNEHHFIERHEKAHPHAGEFKTKVRWGDKHGGYGEHYWDYNHDGHDHDGGESQQNEEYASYEEESQNSPTIVESSSARGKREPSGDVEFISDKARSLILDGGSGRKHGGNYRRAGDFRGKRQPQQLFDGADLVYQADAGVIVDRKTGAKYELKAVKQS